MNSKNNRRFTVFASAIGRRGLAAATAIGLVLTLATASFAVNYSTSPGKNSAFESSTGNVLTGLAPQLTATIEKGKKRTVLAIEASYGDGPYTPTASTARIIGINVTVNGVTAQPNPLTSWTYLVDCGYNGDIPPRACSTTGTFWFDIDAAELANPGLFVNQPLSIVLSAGDLSGGAGVGVMPMDASLSVRVTKK